MTLDQVEPHTAVFEDDEIIVLEFAEELARMASAATNFLTANFLRSHSTSYRARPSQTWIELSDRRTAILGAPGLLAMLDHGLPDRLDQLRAELIVDQLWTGRVRRAGLA